MREKRRSSGVVHLASTESTGGSTTGDDEGSSDACIAHMDDRHIANQHQLFPVSCSVSSSSYSGAVPSNLTNYHVSANSTNMPGDIRKKIQASDISLSYPQAHKVHHSGSISSTHITSNFGHNQASISNTSFGDLANDSVSSSSASRCGEGSISNSTFYSDIGKVNISHDRAPACSFHSTANSHIGLRGASTCRRDKSPSDLEADDENDHDSLNQSETGSGSNVSVCNVGLPSSGNLGGANLDACTSTAFLSSEIQNQISSNYRGLPESTSGGMNTLAGDVMNLTDVVEENKRLVSLMEEKDRRIHLLEYKVQQLMRDTLTISEEQSRLQKENSTLLRALSKLTMSKEKHKS